MQTDTNQPASTYDQVIALLPQLTVDDLARLENEIRRRIQRDPNGDMARKRAAINALPFSFSADKANDEQS